LSAAFAVEGESREQILVAAVGDHVDGFLVYSLVLDEASIHSIAVQPARRRQGLGRQLLVAALALMRRAGATRCLLEVRGSNTAAKHLYEDNGFKVDGTRRNYYPDRGSGPEDALLMSRAL